MNLVTEPSGETPPSAPVRWWVLGLGCLPLAGAMIFAGRLVWEQTVWTWQRGPQMVGFSLAHGSGAILYAAPLLLAIWTLVVLVVIVVDLARKGRTHVSTWASFIIAVLIFVVLCIPSWMWQRLFIRQMASSPCAGDLVVYAAYDKQLGTVKAFLEHGVSIGASDRSERRTPLHAAAYAGDLRLIQFLVSRGANVNALDRSGDSPVELAASEGHEECVKYLREHGGSRIRGDEAQHDKAIEDKVRDAIEEMNRSRIR